MDEEGPRADADVLFEPEGVTGDLQIDPTMSAEASGSGYRVVGDEYEILIEPIGITALYLLNSDKPDTDVLGGSVHVCYSILRNAPGNVLIDLTEDSTVGLDENTDTRAVVSVSGDLEEIGNPGTTYGTAEFHVYCYPDRFVVYQKQNIAAAAPGDPEIRQQLTSFNESETWNTYKYCVTATGNYSDRNPTSSYGAYGSTAGPWSFVFGFDPASDPWTGPRHSWEQAVEMGSAWSSNLEVLDKDDDAGSYLLFLCEQNCSKSVDYESAMQVTVRDTVVVEGQVWGFDTDAAKAQRVSYFDRDLLDGSAGHGDVLVGTLKTDEATDLDSDGFDEGAGCYHITASAKEVKIKLDRNANIPADEYDYWHPALAVHSADAAIDYARSSTNGSDWTDLTAGTDFNHDSDGSTAVFEYLGDVDKTFYLHIAWTEFATGPWWYYEMMKRRRR